MQQTKGRAEIIQNRKAFVVPKILAKNKKAVKIFRRHNRIR